MIKENKKNKIITFLCAFLIVCASALGLVSAVGTTLASSPTQPTITTDYYNYENSNFLNLFDGYIVQFNTGSTLSTLTFNITHVNALPSAYNSNNFTFINFYYLSGNDIDSYNPGVDGIYTTNGMFGGLPTIKFVINTSGNFVNSMIYAYSYVCVFSYNNVYYTICPLDLYLKHSAYMEGLADADTDTAYNNGYNTGYSEGQTNGYNSGVTDGQNNVINNPNIFDLYTQAQYEQNYTNGYNTGVTQGQNNVINNPNAFGLYTQAQYQQNYQDGYNAGVTQGQNNVINNPNDFGLNTNQQLQDSYNEGFNDGEQSSEAYQNGYNTGYTDGSNEVLNNPNNYDLYTQAQYQQNYTDGYNAGVLNSQYGILSNVVISGLVQVNDLVDGVNNSDFDFNAGTITPNSSLISSFNSIYNSSESDFAIAQIRFTLSEQFIYSRDNIINFVNLSLLDNNTSYLSVTYETNSNETVNLLYSYNAIFDNGSFTGYNIGVIGDDTALINNTIKSFVINYSFGSHSSSGITLTKQNLVKSQALSIFATNVQFNNGYNIGYINGYEISFDAGYDKGTIDGFNSGYAEGLANKDNATFASMISAVIDVPINAMRNLFNFELLGINLFGFFTALFTLLVVITIIRLILGGK